MKPCWFDRKFYVVTTEQDREAVLYVQRVLGLEETGELTDGVKSHIRGLQVLFGLNPTGLLDEETAEQIERIYPYGA